MTVCRCIPRGMAGPDGDCMKCGRPMVASSVAPKAQPTDAELRRRRKISEYNLGRSRAKRAA